MVNWKMYAKIQELRNKKFKKTQVAKQLGIDRETVAKYWEMSPDEFAAQNKYIRECKAAVYKDIILEWLHQYPDISAAQLYDWLKERTGLEVLTFQQRSFRDYVRRLREEYDIKKPLHTRQYEAVDELPAGLQGQVDMGEILLATEGGKNKKVYCFAMVLSHSRYKYILWQERPYTTETFIQAHIKAFSFYGGRPKEIVYDQDKVLAVSENNGDIIYTAGFQNYINEMKFSVFLCRGADPESKGKVENVVKYAKHGFAEHRKFKDIDSFNADCLKWLERTGNKEKHGTTHKRPVEEFAIEKEYLVPVSEYSFTSAVNESITYPIRKDNIVLYKGNRYRVPKGTYDRSKRVYMVIDSEEDTVAITDMITGAIYAKHPLCHEKGKLIGQKRDTRDSCSPIAAQEESLKALFANDELVGPFLEHIHAAKPRYYRDQLGVIRALFEEWNAETVIKGLHYCSERELYSAGDLKSSIIYLTQAERENNRNRSRDGTQLPTKYQGSKPEVRSLSIYEEAMKGVS